MIVMKLYLFLFLVISLSIQAEVYQFINGKVLRDHQWIEEDFWVKDGQIVSIQAEVDDVIDVKGQFIAPGYIDLQINGAFGVDFSQKGARVEEVARKLPQYGVTAFLPTLVSLQEYQPLIQALQPKTVTGGATLLGIHLEGPFFTNYGAHNPAFIKRRVDTSIYGDLAGVKIVTLAPELDGAIDAITKLTNQNIVVSIGHSLAKYEDAVNAIAAGATLSTHLFNTMPALHHRTPGMIGAILTHPQMSYSIIVDGIHVHPAMIALAWQAHPKGLVLITDAIEALGLPEGTYQLGSQTIEVANGKAVVAGTNTLAGSILTLDQAVRNLKQFTQCSAIDAIVAATLKPAQVLNIADHKGQLNIGSDADFIILNDDLEVQACYIAGELAWSSSEDATNKR